MLIWYTNVPEEAIYYARRAEGGWQALSTTSVLLAFVLPFLVLLLRRARGSGAVLTRVSLALIAGQALDLYGLVGPPLAGAHPSLGWIEVAGWVAGVALWFSFALRALRAEPAAAEVTAPAEGSPPHPRALAASHAT